MSTPPDPKPGDVEAARPVDELASALVDGLLEGDEAARATADPDVAARADEIRQARHALRDVPPPTAAARDTAIAAALDAFDDPADDTTAQPIGTTVDNVRRIAPRRLRPWLAAAAGLAVIAVAAGLLSQLGNNGDDVVAQARDAADEAEPPEETAADDADAPAIAADDEAEDTEARTDALESAGPSAPALPADVPDLGDASDADQLTGNVMASSRRGEGVLTAADIRDAGAASPPLGCAALSAAGDPGRGMSVYVAEARLRGEPVTVHLYGGNGIDNADADNDRLRLVATNNACDDLVDELVSP